MSVRDVLVRTDLAALLTELAGEPSTAGRFPRWRCCAREHPDDHPSVTMFRDRRGVERWKCWSAGHGGTAIDAVMAARGVSTAEAVRLLEERAGITPPVTRPALPPAVAAASVATFSTEAREHAYECADRLWSPQARPALDWLHRRGLTDAVLKSNLVGFDPGHRELHRPRGVPGWRPQHLPPLRAVTYPSFSCEGDMIYIQARYLDDGAPSKYANPSSRHGPLPALTFPRTPVRAIGPVIVTEGIADGLIAVTAGFRAAAVISAATASQASADELAAYASRSGVILAFDNDQAGQQAQATLRGLLADRVCIRTLRLAPGHDLTDSYRPTRAHLSLAR